MKNTFKLTITLVFILLLNIPIGFSLTNNIGQLSSNSAPVVEILEPENNSIHYTREINISVKCTDDISIDYVHVEFESLHSSRGYGFGFHFGKIGFINETVEISPGYNLMVATAYDGEGNIGYDTKLIYYNASNDIYPPDVRIYEPYRGEITFFGKEIYDDYTMNYAIVIGKFNIRCRADDIERNLQTMILYIDDEEIYREEFTDQRWQFIEYDYPGFIFGLHTIKVEAIDSFGNSAVDELDCFLFNLR